MSRVCVSSSSFRTTWRRHRCRCWQGAVASISAGTVSTCFWWEQKRGRYTSAPRRTAGSTSRRTRAITWPFTLSGLSGRKGSWIRAEGARCLPSRCCDHPTEIQWDIQELCFAAEHVAINIPQILLHSGERSDDGWGVG